VVAIDHDADRLNVAEKAARKAKADVEWVCADLTTDPIPGDPYDLVMVFYYLDRHRIPDLIASVKPGGYLLMETFMEQQRELGWGPTADEHLLKSRLWTDVPAWSAASLPNARGNDRP
jgi:ubiquinone/menaquinone biosynthesis C-methylase UbiE